LDPSAAESRSGGMSAGWSNFDWQHCCNTGMYDHILPR
jgi:hypothetical protein